MVGLSVAWLLFCCYFSIFWGNGFAGEPYTHQAAKFLVSGISETHDWMSSCDDNRDCLYVPLLQGQFKAYHPAIFKRMQEKSGISDNTLQTCLLSENLHLLSSDSKSGQAFWFSSNGKIVLKTIKPYECRNLRKVIKELHLYMENNDHSCISGLLGLYRVKLKNGRKIYFVATKNVYQRYYSQSEEIKYDLKGSTVGRSKSLTSTVYKDMDLLKSNIKFNLGYAKPMVLDILRRDTELLSKFRFMDYSLLIDVENNRHTNRFMDRFISPVSKSKMDRGKLVVIGDDGLIYHIGIIDFLQKYSFRKYIETFLKGLFWDWRKISCVPPKFYSRRMVDFIDFNSY